MLLAACGGGGEDESEATTTTEPSTIDLTVHFVPEQRGLGCVGTPAAIGTRLTVLDEDGSTLGVATFDLSPGLVFGEDSCDFTAVVNDIEPSDFLTLRADNTELITVGLDEVESGDGTIELVTIGGDVRLVD